VQDASGQGGQLSKLGCFSMWRVMRQTFARGRSEGQVEMRQECGTSTASRGCIPREAVCCCYGDACNLRWIRGQLQKDTQRQETHLVYPNIIPYMLIRRRHSMPRGQLPMLETDVQRTAWRQCPRRMWATRFQRDMSRRPCLSRWRHEDGLFQSLLTVSASARELCGDGGGAARRAGHAPRTQPVAMMQDGNQPPELEGEFPGPGNAWLTRYVRNGVREMAVRSPR